MPELKYVTDLSGSVIENISMELNILRESLSNLKSLNLEVFSAEDKKALNLKIAHAENLYNSLSQEDRFSELNDNESKILSSLVYYTNAVLVYKTEFDVYGAKNKTENLHELDNYDVKPQGSQEYEEHATQLGLFALELEKMGQGRTDRPWLKTVSTIALTLSVVALVAAGVIFTGGLGVVPVAGVAAYFGVSAATLGWIGTGLAIGGGVGAGVSSYGRFGYAPGRGEAGHASRLAQGGKSTPDKKIKNDDDASSPSPGATR